MKIRNILNKKNNKSEPIDESKFYAAYHLRQILESLMDLPEVSSITDPETAAKYADVGGVILNYADSFYGEGDKPVESPEEDNDMITDEMKSEIVSSALYDFANLMKLLKPAFSRNGVTPDSEIGINVTGEEYNMIKSFIDEYSDIIERIE